jgi:hypothetical protein
VAPAVGHVLVQEPQLEASAQNPSAHVVGELHVRHPFASVTHVWSSPPVHATSPAVHAFVHVAQLVASPQVPSGQAVGSPQERQPFASATQARTSPSAHAVTPALVHTFAIGAPHERQPSSCRTQVLLWPSLHSIAPASGQVSWHAPPDPPAPAPAPAPSGAPEEPQAATQSTLNIPINPEFQNDMPALYVDPWEKPSERSTRRAHDPR